MTSGAGSGRYAHLDPDTGAAFEELATLADGDRKERLREEILRAWLPMAHRLARRYTGRGESDEDLRQVAALGLLKAIDAFDPRADTPFGAFAVPTIVGELKRHFRDAMWAVHVPRSVKDLRTKVFHAREELAARAGQQEVTVRDLAAHTGLTQEEVLLGLDAENTFTALSLERPLGGDGSDTLGELVGQEDPALALVDDRAAATVGLRMLPERERRILYLRYFMGLTQKEIGDRVGLSQMHISRLLRRSCDFVREQTFAAPRT
ncbi:SigB/SigF/SigG family RNA polymerase sigma factor [Streptomyces sp. NPDC001739]|uniref:SigB/SigF/SigG family RNA polymerase sigma factor n=1 Tax=Streptomyces siderophoricus TaxID=2802281 RepID=A0ABS1MNI6_9ACTN|nr:SigB/SigF/SigG family RNA polymerase sigma factor [Streptomyces sp. 9-7]MBL1089341.1 SigB/SigF/SigG family RNA polymerase sigma factor [Streptomyces sp. 9-7]